MGGDMEHRSAGLADGIGKDTKEKGIVTRSLERGRQDQKLREAPQGESGIDSWKNGTKPMNGITKGGGILGVHPLM